MAAYCNESGWNATVSKGLSELTVARELAPARSAGAPARSGRIT